MLAGVSYEIKPIVLLYMINSPKHCPLKDYQSLLTSIGSSYSRVTFSNGVLLCCYAPQRGKHIVTAFSVCPSGTLSGK